MPAIERRHYEAAQDAMLRGKMQVAHAHAQAALRLSAAGGPDEVAVTVPAQPSKSKRLHQKDSFTFYVHEKAPTPALVPPAADAAAPITLDEAKYAEFLKRKASLARVTGNKLTMTI